MAWNCSVNRSLRQRKLPDSGIMRKSLERQRVGELQGGRIGASGCGFFISFYLCIYLFIIVLKMKKTEGSKIGIFGANF